MSLINWIASSMLSMSSSVSAVPVFEGITKDFLSYSTVAGVDLPVVMTTVPVDALISWTTSCPVMISEPLEISPVISSRIVVF